MPFLRNLRSAQTAPVYDADDAFQDAVVEQLEAGVTELDQKALSLRAQTLLESADRTARRNRERLAQLAGAEMFKHGSRRLSNKVARNTVDAHKQEIDGPDLPQVPVTRANEVEDALIGRIDYQRFVEALSPEMRELVQHVEAGETYSGIAKKLGVDRETVVRRLRSLAPLAQQYLRGE